MYRNEEQQQGHALKKVGATRMSPVRYANAKAVIASKLSSHLHIGFAPELPGSSNEKFASLPQVIVALIKSVFGSAEVVCNGDITSFAFECSAEEENSEIHCIVGETVYHQIDLIKCSDAKHLSWMQFYQSYADLGGILGRMTNRCGIKLGQDGLYLHITTNTLAQFKLIEDNRDDTWTITTLRVQDNKHSNEGKIMLTMDPGQVCSYLGLSLARWQQGFLTEQEVFDWMLCCRLHNTEALIRQQQKSQLRMKHSERKRLQLRGFYRSYLEYIGIDCGAVQDNSLHSSRAPSSGACSDLATSVPEPESDTATVTVAELENENENVQEEDDEEEDIYMWQLAAVRDHHKQDEMTLLLAKKKKAFLRKLERAAAMLAAGEPAN